MARPPFEESVLSIRPPQTEGTPPKKLVPQPKSCSDVSGSPPTPSTSKGGMIGKLIVGIGFVAGMIGIGAFVGILVIWMGRIELTSRLPPGGTPVENSSWASKETPSGSGSLPARLSHSPLGSDRPLKTLAKSSGEEDTPRIYIPDRSQILVELEVIQVDRAKAEQALRQSALKEVSPWVQKLVEGMVWSAKPGQEGSKRAEGSSSADSPSEAKASQPGLNLSEKTTSEEKQSPLRPAGAKTPTETEGAAPKPVPQPATASLLEGGKHTQSFRERWGITGEQIKPSGDFKYLQKGEGSSGSSISAGASDRSSRAEVPSSARLAREKSPGGAGVAPALAQPPGSPTEEADPNAPSPVATQMEGVSEAEWQSAVEELQRLKIASRIGSAKLALLHRWPSQIDLVHPGLGEAGRASSEPRNTGGPVCTGILYCLAERQGEDRFTLELVGKVPHRHALVAGPNGKEESASPAASTVSTPPRPGFSPEKCVFYIFPPQVCQTGRGNLLMSFPSWGREQTGELLLWVWVRGKVQNQPPPVGQTPLSESELRERAVAQCRYLETLLQARFPTSRIQLSLAAGKIFVHGQAANWADQEEILGLLRRRAILQWKVHQLSSGNGFAGVGMDSGDSAVVNMLQVAQVRFRVQMVELAFPAGVAPLAAKSERSSSSAMADLSAESRHWLQLVTGAACRHQAVVVPAVSAAQWEELRNRKAARIVWEQELVTPSGRKETVTLKDSEWSGSEVRASAQPPHPLSPGGVGSPRTPRDQETGASRAPRSDLDVLSSLPSSPQPSSAKGRQWLLELLAQRADHGTIRLEVAPTLSEGVPTAQSNSSGLLSQTYWWQIHALVPPGQWLVAPIPDLSEPTKTPTPPCRVLLVCAEVLDEGLDGNPQISGQLSSSVELAQDKEPGASRSNNTQAPTSQPVRKAQPASYQEALDRPPLAKEKAASATPSLSRENQPPPATTPSERLQVLQEVLTHLFPHSQVHLRWEADRLIVEGQAANPAEATQILAVVRAEAVPEQPEKISVVNRLRVAPTSSVQYLLRVRFVRVDGLALRQSAEKVKRNFPTLVPLAGALLDLAERGGHLVLEPNTTQQLPDLLAQAQRLDLVRVVAQPTFGLLPGQPAEYLLPLSAVPPESKGPPTPLQGEGVPARGNYLLWRLTAQWTEQSRWQLEITLELGGRGSSGKEGSRSRLVAELLPGQTSAAAIPGEFYPGSARLVVLTTPEIREAPQIKEDVTPMTESGRSSEALGGSYQSGNRDHPIKESAPAPVLPQPKDPLAPVSSSRSFSAGANPIPLSPSMKTPSQEGDSSPQNSLNPSVAPWPRGTERAGSSSPAAEKSAAASGPHQPHGLLPKLGQLFRNKKEEKSSSAPGYTVAESPEPPSSPPLEVTVPEAPQPDSSDRRIIPRVIRP